MACQFLQTTLSQSSGTELLKTEELAQNCPNSPEFLFSKAYVVKLHLEVQDTSDESIIILSALSLIAQTGPLLLGARNEVSSLTNMIDEHKLNFSRLVKAVGFPDEAGP